MKHATKTAWIIIGIVFCLGGLAGLVLPIIPGIPLLLIGVSILASYFAYARLLRMRLKKMVKQARDVVSSNNKN